MSVADPPAARAQRWWWERMSGAVEETRPLACGRVVRSRTHPGYWDFNKVIVERADGLSAEALLALLDAELADARHRRCDVLDVEAGLAMRETMAAAGYRALVLLVMGHQGERGSVASARPVQQVPFDAVRDLRRAWHREDDRGGDFEHFYDAYRAVALTHDPRVLAWLQDGDLVGYAQLEHFPAGSEVGEVFVRADHRRRGLGRALTAAAVRAAPADRDLWIAADAEDRVWRLYERLGFRRAWSLIEFERAPA